MIDECGASQMLVPENKRKKTIGIKEIEATVATMARIPPKTVSKDDAEVLQTLETTLKRMVYGQDNAIQQLAAAIKLSRAGLRDGEKPIGSYLFSGPTGVGKTEVAKQLAKVLGVELLRFDMSEYMERHTVSRLIGAPPGYVGFDQGGLLTDGRRPAPALRAAAGRDREGPSGPLQHPPAGDGPRQADRQQRQAGRFPQRHPDHDDECRRGRHGEGGVRLHAAEARGRRHGCDQPLFTPEFRNRLDATVSFGHLPTEVVAQVVDKFIMQLDAQLAERNVSIELSDEARKWLVENGYDQAMGARPMARLIQSAIKTPLADEVLFGRLKNGGTVRVIVTGDDSGARKLGFVYPDGPLLPRPERMVEEASKKPVKKRAGGRKSAKSDGPTLDKRPSIKTSPGTSVPKVPLKS